MAPPITVKVLERLHISPPPSSAPPTSLPLTFFDIPWLLFSPSQPLFFYEFPFSPTFFTSTTLPNIKHSLSLTLQHFHPLAGHLNSPPEPGKPEIVYADGDSVSLTIAESDGDFNHLCENYPRDFHEFCPLVPKLPSTMSGDTQLLPLLAVQITVFRNSGGMCIGLAYHHVAADERTFNNFMKTWASICRSGEDSAVLIKWARPSYDRTVIMDTSGLELVLLKQWWTHRSTMCRSTMCTNASTVLAADMVLATFLIGPTDMERIKQWIIDGCKKKSRSPPLLLSAYVLTCAFVWVCLVKAREFIGKKVSQEPIYFGFVAGGITRLDYPVPTTYFGNCVAFGRSVAMRNELVGENGLVVAAEAIGNTVKKLDGAVLGGAEKWISDWEVLFGSELHIMASGSPKVDLYETDFGWGRPKKIEDASIDGMRAISLTESRDLKGGIEVGLVLPKATMAAFSSIFTQGLKLL